jgi:hypothetical protein
MVQMFVQYSLLVDERFTIYDNFVSHEVTTSKGEKHESVYKEELENIDNHPSQGYLKRTKMWIDAEDVYKFQEALYKIKRLSTPCSDGDILSLKR